MVATNYTHIHFKKDILAKAFITTMHLLLHASNFRYHITIFAIIILQMYIILPLRSNLQQNVVA